MRLRRRRSGANALEFALTLPIVLAVMAAMVDYGWLFFTELGLQSATRDGVRTASVSPPTEDPVARARAATKTALSDAAIDPTTVTITVLEEGAFPDARIRVTTSMNYQPFFGLVPVPSTIGSSLAMRLEAQAEDTATP